MDATDTYSLPARLWEPQARAVVETVGHIEAGRDVCLYSPTGGGKTEVAIELLKWAKCRGWTGSFYVNRKLLIAQTVKRFDGAGLPCGVRAADYEDLYDCDQRFQVCSADTERSRVFNRKVWGIHKSDVVIVDEAHIQKAETMREILRTHKLHGARVVLMTATPVGLSDLADVLVIPGTMADYRACKAIVPAIVRSIEQPDLSRVKRNAVGEYVWKGRLRRQYIQSIIGNVYDRWQRYNPDARPTLLYAPGKAESVWITERFEEHGVRWVHVDATDAVVDGQRAKLTRALWGEILERYKNGDVKGLSSRFKLREGIDIPETYHCILATPIGSLTSYVQTVGRVLRWSSQTPGTVLVTDHGGNYLRHGSPNADRPWEKWWDLPERVVSTWKLERIREKEEPEPIRCPQCEGERLTGFECPHCGFKHQKSRRHILMLDGRMRVVDGPMVKQRRPRIEPDTQELWTRMYWGWSKKKVKRTFAQMLGYFTYKHHYRPPKDLLFMPRRPEDWHRHVHAVPRGELR